MFCRELCNRCGTRWQRAKNTRNPQGFFVWVGPCYSMPAAVHCCCCLHPLRLICLSRAAVHMCCCAKTAAMPPLGWYAVVHVLLCKDCCHLQPLRLGVSMGVLLHTWCCAKSAVMLALDWTYGFMIRICAAVQDRAWTPGLRRTACITWHSALISYPWALFVSVGLLLHASCCARLLPCYHWSSLSMNS